MKEIYNRELSWLQFNDRVLQEAKDKSVPLIQRLRFLGIFSNNQDEFIKVRVANLIRYNSKKSSYELKMTGGYTPSELLPLINQNIQSSQATFRQIYSGIISEMEENNVFVVDQTMLTDEQKQFCKDYFFSVISVRLVPIMLRKSIDIPLLPDGKIYLAIKMSGTGENRYAILEVPVSDKCPRFVVLPSSVGRTDIIFIDDIIRLFLSDIFFIFNYNDISAHTFKIVRDAELTFDDDISKSVTEKLLVSLNKRERGRAVRMIYDKDMPADVLDIISKKMNLKSLEQIEKGGKYHLMRDLMGFPRVRPDLEYQTLKPLIHPKIDPSDSILKVIKKQDILLSFPYHTFNHFIDLLREAAIDPRVHSIYIALYRTASQSKVIKTLLNAVKNGKQVTAHVELKARFDEEQNMDSIDILQNGGVRVINSLDILKVHCKLALIERREGNSNRGYVYVGTGNFNENTASVYSDFGLLTADIEVANDARKVFDFLQNMHKHPVLKRLILSPYYMRKHIEGIISNEIKNAKKGKKAYVHFKMNSLTDEKMVSLLYKASAAGVTIKLIVRGACCLQAGVKGLSENIEVRSIVDKYLEHARLLICCNGDNPKAYIMSADLMTRNLDRRVEVGIPINDPEIYKTLEDYFNIEWKDNVKSRIIRPPYTNEYVVKKPNEKDCRSQIELYKYFGNLSNE